MIKAGREDLIGYGTECLVRPAGGANQTRKPAQGKVQGKPAQGKPAQGRPAQGKPTQGKPTQGKKPVTKTGGKPAAKASTPAATAAPAKKKPAYKEGWAKPKKKK